MKISGRGLEELENKRRTRRKGIIQGAGGARAGFSRSGLNVFFSRFILLVSATPPPTPHSSNHGDAKRERQLFGAAISSSEAPQAQLKVGVGGRGNTIFWCCFLPLPFSSSQVVRALLSCSPNSNHSTHTVFIFMTITKHLHSC